ncbi:hypothetical protein [Streptomyces sp. SMS_SU21]|nr:hypothetical protein [Streptomyces sp. SMS_SU21]
MQLAARMARQKEMIFLCQRYDTLRSQALNPTESRDLLERLREEL